MAKLKSDKEGFIIQGFRKTRMYVAVRKSELVSLEYVADLNPEQTDIPASVFRDFAALAQRVRAALARRAAEDKERLRLEKNNRSFLQATSRTGQR